MKQLEIALPIVKCNFCNGRGEGRYFAPINPLQACPDCHGLGFIGYRITESQVREIVEALQIAAQGMFHRYSPDAEEEKKIYAALDVLVKHE